MNTTLSQAADSMHGVLHGEDRTFHGVSTDTRSIREGQMFFALQGPNFDGCDYVGQAKISGAAGAVVNRLVDVDIAQIQVDDAKLALGRFAAAWRDNKNVRVVGITGSNGKTTLKELVAACLRTAAPTLATEGNLNNDIGMPLMLARLDDEHEYAVLEMGANHAGEIANLASLANPDVVVITNAGAAHLEGFGSIQGVAHAKGEILQVENRPAFAVLNADDDYYDYWSSLVEDVQALSFRLAAAAARDSQSRSFCFCEQVAGFEFPCGREFVAGRACFTRTMQGVSLAIMASAGGAGNEPHQHFKFITHFAWAVNLTHHRSQTAQ